MSNGNETVGRCAQEELSWCLTITMQSCGVVLVSPSIQAAATAHQDKLADYTDVVRDRLSLLSDGVTLAPARRPLGRPVPSSVAFASTVTLF